LLRFARNDEFGCTTEDFRISVNFYSSSNRFGAGCVLYLRRPERRNSRIVQQEVLMRVPAAILPLLVILAAIFAGAPEARATVLGNHTVQSAIQRSAEPVYYYKRYYNDDDYYDRPYYRHYRHYRRPYYREYRYYDYGYYRPYRYYGYYNDYYPRRHYYRHYNNYDYYDD
jgi:hypothetical protein